MEEKKKGLIGASVVTGLLVVVIAGTGYANFQETRHAESLQVKTQAELKKLEAKVTPSMTPSATPIPSKGAEMKVASPTANTVKGK